MSAGCSAISIAEDTPIAPPPRRHSNSREPTLPLTSGYIQRAKHLFFKQGVKKPWRVNPNYARDVVAFRFGAIQDGALKFGRRKPQPRGVTNFVRSDARAMIIKRRTWARGRGPVREE